MENESRRTFLKQFSLVSLGTMPTFKALAGLIDFGNNVLTPIEESYYISYAYRLIRYEQLLELEFYFVNASVSQSGSSLYPSIGVPANGNTLMVVRLPQQHIVEEYDKAVDLLGDDYTRLKRLRASAISGYSYLCFLVDFENAKIKSTGFPINADSFLDWNADYLSLVSKPDNNIQPFILSPNPPDEHPEINEIYPLSFRAHHYNRYAYPNASSKEGVSKEHLNLSPFTALELPYRLILSPRLPSMEYDAVWIFSGYKSETEKTYELWIATLKLIKKENSEHRLPPNKKDDNLTDNQGEAPIGATNYINKDEAAIQLLICGSPDYPETQNTTFKKTLPNGDDRNNLVSLGLLNLVAKAPYISFTPLGASIRIAFFNKDFEVNKINLYQWNQIISFGRDQHAELVKVVVESCSGCKMLHIRTTDREMYKKHGLLIYREFLMPLEKEKNLYTYKSDSGDKHYTFDNYKYNTPFKKVAFATTEARQIYPLDDVENLSNDVVVKDKLKEKWISYAFWALSPDRKYLEWPMIFTDWMGNDKVAKMKLFILQSNLSFSTDKDTIVNEDVNRDKINQLKQSEIKYSDIIIDQNEVESQLNDIVAKILAEKKRRNSNESITINEILHKGITTADPEKPVVGFFNTITETWKKVQFLSDDFHLQIADYLKQKLADILNSAEQKLIAAATQGQRDLEDFTREEWAVFKQNAFNGKNTFENIIYSLQEKLFEVFNATKNNDIRTRAEDILSQLKNAKEDLYKGVLLDDIFNRYKNDITSKVDEFITFFNTLPITSIPEIIAFLNNTKAIIQETVNKKIFGFSEELTKFFQAVPKDITSIVETELKGASEFCSHIAHLETSLRSRIDTAKVDICYTVYRAEDEFDNIKRRFLEKETEIEQQLNIDKRTFDAKLKQYEEAFHQAVNGGLATMQTDFLIFRRNFKKSEQNIFDFFDQFSCFPQLHTAQVYVKTLNDMVNTEIPLKIKLAEQYYRNQIDDKILEVKNNTARIFAEVHTDAQELLRGAMRSIGSEVGGMVSPSIATHFLTFLTDTSNKVNGVIEQLKYEKEEELQNLRKQMSEIKEGVTDKIQTEFRDFCKEKIEVPFEDFLAKKRQVHAAFEESRQKVLTLTKEVEQSVLKEAKELRLDAEAFFKGLEANIIGSIYLKDILGVDFNLPKLDRTRDKVTYQFINKKFRSFDVKIFKFIPENTDLLIYAEKGLKDSSYFSKTRLTNFRISVFDERLIIKFNSLEITSSKKEKNKVSASIGDVRFGKELSFLGALQKGLTLPGSGLKISITPLEIKISYSLAIPGMSGGAFTFDKLKFLVGLSIPLPIGPGKRNEPVSIALGINNAEEQFAVGVLIFGGFGHFVLETTPKYLKRIDAGISFGGLFSINLGIAAGQAFLQAGVRYVYSRNALGETSMELYALLTCGASVTVFGFIEISIVFTMYLKYQQDSSSGAALYGVASVTCSVRIGFFSKSFTLTFSKKISGSGSPNTSSIGYNNLRKHKGDDLIETRHSEDMYLNDDCEWQTKSEKSMFRFADYEFEDDDKFNKTKDQAKGRLDQMINAYNFSPQ